MKWVSLLSNDETHFLIAGVLALIARIFRYKIYKIKIIFIEALYVIVMCLLVVPWIKETLDLGEKFCYLLSFLLCHSGTTFIDTITKSATEGAAGIVASKLPASEEVVGTDAAEDVEDKSAEESSDRPAEP